MRQKIRIYVTVLIVFCFILLGCSDTKNCTDEINVPLQNTSKLEKFNSISLNHNEHSGNNANIPIAVFENETYYTVSLKDNYYLHSGSSLDKSSSRILERRVFRLYYWNENLIYNKVEGKNEVCIYNLETKEENIIYEGNILSTCLKDNFLYFSEDNKLYQYDLRAKALKLLLQYKDATISSLDDRIVQQVLNICAEDNYIYFSYGDVCRLNIDTREYDVLYKNYGSRGIIIDEEWLFFINPIVKDGAITRAKKSGNSAEFETVLESFTGPINIFKNSIYYRNFTEGAVELRKANCDTGEYETIWRKTTDGQGYITSVIFCHNYIFINYHEVENSANDNTYYLSADLKDTGVLQ